MLTLKNLPTPFLAATVCSLLSAPLATAATVDQVQNPTSNQGWNTSTIWNEDPAPGNDYRVSPDLMTSVTPYIVNGTSWTVTGQVRDVSDANAAARTESTTFGGNSLIVPANTRILGKSTGGSTQTVNVVLDGGLYHQGGPTNNAIPSSTLAGTITFGSANLGALGVSAGGASFTWTINSTIIGGADKTLQLTMGNTLANASRMNFLNVTGDLSGFSGTLYLGVSTGGVNDGGTGAGSSFSISSNATLATVQLDTSTNNFQYDLGSGNVTFGALSLGSGEGTPVSYGVYDMSQLNALAGGNFFIGAGTITVVPEPSTAALGSLALILAALGWRLRRNRLAA